MYKEEAYEEVMLQEIEFELMNGETYTERVFLTGADPLSVGYEKMMRILKLIQKYYPYCGCVAMYAAVRTINNYTVEELKQLHAAGLRLLYIGFESGSDEVLKSIRKGHTVKNSDCCRKKIKMKQDCHSMRLSCMGLQGKEIQKRTQKDCRDVKSVFRQVRSLL